MAMRDRDEEALLVGRREVLLGLLAALASPALLAALTQAASEPRFTLPPGEETPEIRGLINRAEKALQSGRTVSEILADATYMPAHPWPRFRSAIRQHAKIGPLTLVSVSEPGEPLHVRGVVKDGQGKPLPGALLYVYQTSAKGWYAGAAAHVSGNSGDQRHARLFGYLKTDAAGRYEVRTIRPAGYPDSNLPAHIHVEIRSENPPRSRVTEICFDDDPRQTPEWRERTRREGFLICKVERGAKGLQSLVADFQMR